MTSCSDTEICKTDNTEIEKPLIDSVFLDEPINYHNYIVNENGEKVYTDKTSQCNFKWSKFGL